MCLFVELRAFFPSAENLKTLKALWEMDTKSKLSPEKAEQKTAFHLQLWPFLPVLFLSVLHSVVAWSYHTVTFDLGKY